MPSVSHSHRTLGIGALTAGMLVIGLLAGLLASAAPPPTVTPANSSVTQNPASVPADGVTAITITATVRDQDNNPMSGVAVTVTSSRGSADTIAPPSGTTNASGVATFQISSKTVGSPMLTTTAGGVALISPIPTFTQNIAAGGGHSTASQSPPSVVANGSSAIIITVRARNASDGPVPNKIVTMTSSRGASVDTIVPASGATTNDAGDTTLTIASCTAGSPLLSITIDPTENPVGIPAPIPTFAADTTPHAGNSSVSASSFSAPADNATTVRLTATVQNACGQPLGGVMITTTSSRGAAEVISPAGSVVTNSSGVGVTEVRSGTAGTSTYTTTAASVTLPDDTVTITYVAVPPSPDATPPAVGVLLPTNVTAGVNTIIRASYSDNVGVAACDLILDGSTVGAMSLDAPGGAAGTASRTVNLLAGSHTARASCRDAAGNNGQGSSVTIVAAAAVAPPADTAPSPSTSVVDASPTTVLANNSNYAAITVTVKNAGGVALSGKTVTLASNRPVADTVSIISGTTNSFGQAVFTVRSSGAGTTVLTATVEGTMISDTASVTFTASDTPPPPAAGARLIKLACPVGANANHPCKAVYYVGADGKRHAFPNDKVYFTWYADFSGVQVVAQNELSSYPLGKNVTYRPGMKMIKFATLAKTYAVTRGGALRWVASEDVARSLYGTAWNRQVDDVSDAFFTNYTFGADIIISADYSVAAELAAAQTIDASL